MAEPWQLFSLFLLIAPVQDGQQYDSWGQKATKVPLHLTAPPPSFTIVYSGFWIVQLNTLDCSGY